MTDACLKAEQCKLNRALEDGYISEAEYNEAWDDLTEEYYGNRSPETA